MEVIEDNFEEKPQKCICKMCNGENDIDASFCISCGAPLKPLLVCEKCKAENDELAKYCDQCGRELNTPSYRAKQRRKLIIGFILLGLFFLILAFTAISEIRKGIRYYSTKDGWAKEEMKRMNEAKK